MSDPLGNAPGSLQGPGDVNLKPACDQLGVPCGSSKEFPDGGLMLGASYYPLDRVALVGELSLYVNSWFAFGASCPNSPPGESCAVGRTNHVSAALAGVKLQSPVITYFRTSHLRVFASATFRPGGSCSA